MPTKPPEGLEVILNYSFRKPELLREALTHKSYLNELRGPERTGEKKDNERLEFLGDAVLDLVISERLIGLYPELAEGDLSKMKSRLVSEVTLTRVARRMDIGEHLVLGRGEERTRGREKASLLSDALEAVIAGIYLDGGYAAAREAVLRVFEDELGRLDLREEDLDYKTELQELCQQKFEVLPNYRVTSESGPDHQKVFEVRLSIRGEEYGAGTGRSKKEAEQRAARQALGKITKIP